MVKYHVKVLTSNDSDERIFDLLNGYTIGSADTSDLCLKKKGVQAKHCTFRLHNDVLSIYNYDASGMTFIDNFPLKAGKSYIIDQGDTIIIDKIKLKIYKDLGQMKDENAPLESLTDIPIEENKEAVNAIDESLEEFEEDMFANVDPTMIGQLPNEFKAPSNDEDGIEISDADVELDISDREMDDEDLDIDLDEEVDGEDLDIGVDQEVSLGISEEVDEEDEEDELEALGDYGTATNTTTTTDNAIDESLDDFNDDMFAEVDPTKINQIPEELNYKKDIENEETLEDGISQGDMEEGEEEYEVAEAEEGAGNPQTVATSISMTALEKLKEENSNKVSSLGVGANENEVFKSFEFGDDSSGLLGGKDVEEIREQAIDHMASDMSGINILPIDDKVDSAENGEELFSFGDGVDEVYSPDNPLPTDSSESEDKDKGKTNSYVKDFEMSTNIAKMDLADDLKEIGETSGSYNTGVIDLSEEKTKILERRIEDGEDLYPATEEQVDEIGVDPLPPVEEFRPEKKPEVVEVVIAETSLGITGDLEEKEEKEPRKIESKKKEVDKEDIEPEVKEVEKPKKKGLLAKIKDKFSKSADDEDDEDWEDEDEDDWDEDEDEELESSIESSLTGVTDMLVGFFNKEKKQKILKEEKAEKLNEVKDQENPKDSHLSLVEDQEIPENTNDEISTLDLDDDNDESKDFEIEELEDSGKDQSVTNINIKELNEKLKALGEEGKENKKKGAFKSLFSKKESKDEDPSLDDGLEDVDFDLDLDDDLPEMDEDENNFSLDEKHVPQNPIQDDKTDPKQNIAHELEDAPTDPQISIKAQEVEEAKENKESKKEKKKSDKKKSNDKAPSLTKAAKKGKRKSKFKHGEYPWVLGRGYALLASIMITVICYQHLFDIIGIQKEYDIFAQSIFKLALPLLETYKSYLLHGLEYITKYSTQYIPQLKDILHRNQYDLDFLTNFTFFKYLILLSIVEIVGSLMFGISFPKYVMGMRTTDKYPLNAAKSIFRFIFGIITLPLLILDLPILIKMRSSKEVITRTELYYISRKQMLIGTLLLVPAIVSFWYLIPFLNPGLQTIKKVEKASTYQVKLSQEEGLTAFKSNFLAITGKFQSNVKFAYLPSWGKKSVPRITIVDSLLMQSATIEIGKRIRTQSLMNTFLSKNPSLKYMYPSSLTNKELNDFLFLSLSLNILNPITLLGPIKTKVPFTHSLLKLRSKVLNSFNIKSSEVVTQQELKKRYVYTFKQSVGPVAQSAEIVVVGEHFTSHYTLNYKTKNKKARNRIIKSFLTSKSYLKMVKTYKKFNAFVAFDIIEKLKRGKELDPKLIKSIKKFYFRHAKDVVINDNVELRKPLLRSLKSFIKEISKIDKSLSSRKVTKILEKSHNVVNELDKKYFK